MNALNLGGIPVQIDARDVDELAGFLHRISDGGTPDTGTHHLVIRHGRRACLAVDADHQTITLTLLPTGRSNLTVDIGVLQALVRGLAYIERSTNDLALLHGSALTTTMGAVAVLDGGLGQGKTSLAFGLARRNGNLLVDEFTFSRATPDGVVLAAAPTLPWHIRADMAPYLVDASTAARLHYPNDLHAVVPTARHAGALRLILIPDRGADPGHVSPVEPEQVPHFLRYAVTDHLNKLVDPSLDHVSIFEAPDQVTDSHGRPLAHGNTATTSRDTVLDALAGIPTYRIGIGAPTELAASVTAASHLIEELKA